MQENTEGANSAELDLSQLGKFTPQGVKDQYRAIIPRVLEANPDLFNLQTTLAHIRSLEGVSGARLYGVNLSSEATPLQASVFNRKLLKLKAGLKIATDEEKEDLDTIEATFSAGAEKLVKLRGMNPDEADDILVSVLSYRSLESMDDAIDRLTRGPKITGFEKTDLFEFDFTNEELGTMLKDAFGLDAILKSRLLEITKVDGFPVVCGDIAFGNDCVSKYGAKWEGGRLILPDRKAYEEVAMQLEGISKPEDLQHLFKLRASADVGNGENEFSTVTVHDFAVEQPSHFDYLHELPMPDQDKMRAYFLGIIAHEAVHALQAYAIDEGVSDEYRTMASQELSDTLDHQFVSAYVDRHRNIYKSRELEALNEDFAEAVRIYLTNSKYLKQHFSRRYDFIQENLPFVKENAIQQFIG